MPSVLRQLQAEWNSMVPAAQARGVRRVRLLGGGDVERAPLETIAHRRSKVEWLRAILGGTSLTALDTHSFGVEIECILPQPHNHASAAAEITLAGIPCRHEGYGHTTSQGAWKVTTDGSLGNYSRGAEFVSPPLRGEEGFRQVRIVCETLTRIGAKITTRCGLHVHVGVGSEPPTFFKNLIGLYHSAQSAINSLMPQSRRNNVFARPIRINRNAMQAAADVRSITEAIGQVPTATRDQTRYCVLNLKSYFAYGTVEFRQHGGTVDPVKVSNWIRLCLKMVLTARAEEKTVATVDELLDAVAADDAEKQYFKGRASYFGRNDAADRFAQYGSTTAPRAGRIA